jgi:spermidine synthase
MSGLLAGLLHPHPENAAVIGLGTGSTAGWLAAVPSIQRVDVVELEPVLTRFAEQCAPVNHDALKNPKLNLLIGDGRELLLTTKQRYDLVVSEPSNPYRAGIASLFTREYYQAIAQKLNKGGLFAQWMQAYDMDIRTIRIFYATVSSVFPHIETWQTQSGDLLLIASKDPITYDIDLLRSRAAAEPFRTALANVWRTTELEGVFSHYVGNEKFAHQVMRSPGVELNTDDHMLLEFAFARNRQSGHRLSFADMRRDARRVQADRPLAQGALDWKKIEEQRLGMFLAFDHPPQPGDSTSDEQTVLIRALNNYANDNLPAAWENWRLLNREPQNPLELLMVAECLADAGNSKATIYLAQLHEIDATEAEAVRARLLWRQHRATEARDIVGKALASLRDNPWPMQALIRRTIDLAVEIVENDSTGGGGRAIYEALEKPFAVYNNDEDRILALIRVAINLDQGPRGQEVLRSVEALEPNIPWTFGFLKIRSACYTASRHPLAADAQSDLVDFVLTEAGDADLSASASPAIATAGK